MAEVSLAIVLFLSSILSGATAIAGGTIAIGALYLIYPLPEALVIHGLLYISINIYRIYLFFDDLNWKLFFHFAGAAVLIYYPVSLLEFVPDKRTSFVVIGVASILIGLFKLGPCIDPEKNIHTWLSGALVPIFTIFFGIHAPVMDVYFARARISKESVMSTKSIIAMSGHIMKVVYFYPLTDMALNVSPAWKSWVLLLVVVSLSGIFVGKLLVSQMCEKMFKTAGNALIAFCGVVYLIRGLAY